MNNFLLIKRISAFLYVAYAENTSDIPRRGVERVQVIVERPDSEPDDNAILYMEARCIYHLPHNCFILQAIEGKEGNESMPAMKTHCSNNEVIFQKSVHGREQAAINLIMHELREAEEQHPSWPEECIHAAAIVVEEAGELLRDCATFEESGDQDLISCMSDEATQTGAMAVRFLKNLPFSQKRTIPNRSLREIMDSDASDTEKLIEIRQLLKGAD